MIYIIDINNWINIYNNKIKDILMKTKDFIIWCLITINIVKIKNFKDYNNKYFKCKIILQIYNFNYKIVIIQINVMILIDKFKI